MAQFFKTIFYLLAAMAIMFAVAGRLDWWQGWLLFAVGTVFSAMSSIYLYVKDPDLLAARSRFDADTPLFDWVLLILLFLSISATLVLGALQIGRWHHAPLPYHWTLIGLVTYALGTLIITLSMSENTFFEKTVSIQNGRNHEIVDTGPYAVVRHPGYVGFILCFAIAMPLLLGARWAFWPALATLILIIVRTVLEDRFLHHHLHGYPAYAQKVRARLIPFIW